MIGTDKKFTVLTYVCLSILAVCCLVPFLIMFLSSVTAESELIRNGYSLFPKKLSLDAYRYLFSDAGKIFRSYGVSAFVTVVGTAMGLTMMTLMAYCLSVPELPGRKALSFFIFFTLLFNGGIVPTYILWANTLKVTNTIWGLILPRMLVYAFYVIIMRTYFETNIPREILEAARIDGASEARIFLTIVLPMSIPIIATIGLLTGIAYWNEWINGLYFVTDSRLYSIQNILNRMLQDAQFILSNSSNTGFSAADVPGNGIKMAVATLGAAPIIILFPFFQKYYIKGLTVGAVKG